LNNLEHLLRDHSLETRNLLLDLIGIGKEPVNGNQGGDPGRQGKQGVKRHPGGDNADIVLGLLVFDPQKNISPSGSRNLAGFIGTAPPVGAFG